MTLKKSCDTCLHNEVCSYKEITDKVVEKIESSGALTAPTFMNLELNCAKFMTSEYTKNAETNSISKL